MFRAERDYFTCQPKIVCSGTEQTVRIRPLYSHVAFDPASKYDITYTPLENRGRYDGFEEKHHPDYQLVDGVLEVQLFLDGEQEHSLEIAEIKGEEKLLLGNFRLYSVEDDLFNLRPYKGDLHIHSNRSDGRESPGYVAASCRKIGYDFMALTDHGRYAPSIEAQQAFSGIPVDIKIFRGEEVHPPQNPVHIINFGGSASVNDQFKGNSYSTEVAELERELGSIPDARDRYCYASSVWCFEKIRESGGLGIFCHPYWLTREHYHIPASFTDIMFDRRPFDAYELIGGYHLHEVESNMLQVLRYQEERAKNANLPIVGVSDAHGCDRGELFGWYYTIVFSPSSELPDLIKSIRDIKSVAIEHLPDTSPRAHGPFRLARYAHYLMREVFPAHDMMCRAEGEAMIRYLADGDRSSVPDPEGAAQRYMESNFA